MKVVRDGRGEEGRKSGKGEQGGRYGEVRS